MFPYYSSQIIPELYSNEEINQNNNNSFEEDEENQEENEEKEEDIKNKKKKKKKIKTNKDLIMSVAQKFALQRKELKDQVISEVMEAALPDMNEFNKDDFVIGKYAPPPPNKCIQCLQFFGCWTVNIHQAIENGSFEQLEKSLTKSALLLEKEKIEKDYIDEINV